MSTRKRLDLLLLLMQDVGYQLTTLPNASYRAWGQHLLEDWRSLELSAEKMGESLGQEIEVDEVPSRSVAMPDVVVEEGDDGVKRLVDA